MARGTDADVALLASVEAVEAAGAALQDVVAARGLLDPALAAVVTAFAAHHRRHAVAYQEARRADVAAAPDPAVIEALGPAVVNAFDAATLTAAALLVEQALAATAIDLCGRLEDPALAVLVAGVAPVEAQHAAVLASALALAADVVTPDVVTTTGSLLDG